MLYDGTPLGATGLWLLAVSLATLVAVLGLSAARDLPSALRDGWAAHILLALVYLPVLVVLVDALGRRLDVSASAGRWLLGLATLWLLTSHFLLIVLYRQRRAPDAAQRRVIQAMEAAGDSQPIEVYQEAVAEADSVTTVKEVTGRLVSDIVADASATLIADLREAKHDGVDVLGWSQYLGARSQPSAIGTAYGLRLAFALNLADSRIDLPRIIESVLALQAPEGGWSARSQGGDAGQIEVTSWVLAPLIRAGLDPVNRKALTTLFEQMLERPDPVGLNSTSVVATALSTLAQIKPESALLPGLRDRLVSGARPVELADGRAMAFSARLDQQGDLSTVHTARALLALHRATVARPYTPISGDLLPAGVRWLKHAPNYYLFHEPITRDNGDTANKIVIGHFTPAWVARALLALDDLRDVSSLREAIRLTVARQDAGSWVWGDSQAKPIWMAYQGLVAIQEYAMRNLPWPP